MKKILVVCQYYPPESIQKLKDICGWLKEKGFAVTVLTGIPNYPDGVAKGNYSFHRFVREEVDGIEVLRLPLMPRRPSAVGLAFNYLSFMVTSTCYALFSRRKFDSVFCYQTSPVSMMMAAIVFAKKSRCKLVCYCLDLWPESLLAMMKSRDNFVFKLVGKFSKFLYKQADAIAVTSLPFISYFEKEHGFDPKNICYMPQHGNDDFLNIESTANNEKPVFLFAGNIGNVQDVQTIVKAAAKVGRDDFLIRVLGDGRQLQNCIDLAKQLNVSHLVEFLGRKPYSEMRGYYASADAFLISLAGGGFISNTLPAKTQDYMATGKPLFGVIGGATAQVIEDAKCGLVASPGNADELADNLREFITNREKFENCGQNARDYYIKNFSKEKFMSTLIGLLH